MFWLMRGLLIGLIIGCLFGCGADEDSSRATDIPIITIELIDQEENEVSFRLSVSPPPANDLAVLIETQALGPYGDDYEIGYTWLRVPRFSNTRDFKFDLDTFVPWEVRILSLSGRDLNTYPLEGTEVPTGFEFKQYGLGSNSSVSTEQISTQLLDDWPRSRGSLFASVPANAILTFIFNRAPEDVTVSHGNFIIDGNMVIVRGFFPLGDIEVELRWNQGRQHYTWYNFITDPDYDPPKIARSQVYFNDGWTWTFQDGWGFSPDANEIRIDFNEKIWFHEQVTGMPDIQTEDGTKLGWQAEKVFLKENSIKVFLSDGQPLKPETTYIVAGIVTDFANDTEFKLTFTTTDR